MRFAIFRIEDIDGLALPEGRLKPITRQLHWIVFLVPRCNQAKVICAFVSLVERLRQRPFPQCPGLHHSWVRNHKRGAVVFCDGFDKCDHRIFTNISGICIREIQNLVRYLGNIRKGDDVALLAIKGWLLSKCLECIYSRSIHGADKIRPAGVSLDASNDSRRSSRNWKLAWFWNVAARICRAADRADFTELIVVGIGGFDALLVHLSGGDKDVCKEDCESAA